MKRFASLVVLGLLLQMAGYAQTSPTGNWLIYFGNQSFKKDWLWTNEIQHRNYNAFGDLEQLLIRTGIGKNLTPGNNNLLLGVGYIQSEPYATGTNIKTKQIEWRTYQQFITKQNIGRLYLQHRYRLEERFIPDNFKIRLRYFLGLNIPVSKKEMGAKTWYASMYNEIFMHTTSTLFDRNRVYGAIGYQASPAIKLELGLMQQIQQNKSRTQFQLVVFNNLPL
jgi:hypothetical protein